MRVTLKDPSFWDVTVPRILSLYAILTFAILWVGFFVTLIVNPEWLDLIWELAQTLPPVGEIIAWVFVTPIMVFLWIWKSPWSDLIRMLAFAGIVGWTFLAISGFVRAFRKI